MDLIENKQVGSIADFEGNIGYSLFEVNELAVSDNGLIAAAQMRALSNEVVPTRRFDGVLLVWNVLDDTKRMEDFDIQAQVSDLALNADGSILAAGFRDGTIHLYNTHTGEELLILRGHNDVVTSVRFNQGSTQLVSVSRDGTLRIWGI